MDPDDDARVEIQAKVLQNTLSELSSRHESTSPESADLCCVICLDTISEPCRTQPCLHRNFDFLCLVSWLQERATCPLCKADVKEVHYEFTEESKSWKTFKIPDANKEAKTPQASAQARDVYALSRLARRRRRREYAPRPVVTPDEAILRRRHVYRNKLYSLHVGSNRVSQYRDLTPQLFESSPELVSRARMWIRRELQVFEFLSGASDAPGEADDARRQRRASNAEFLLEYIIAILKTVDIQGSYGQAEDMLQEFIGRENTRLFLHELRAWLRSPYTALEDWDRNVQYDESEKAARGNTRREDGEPRHINGYQSYRSGSSSRRTVNHRHEPYRSSRTNSRARQQESVRRYVPD